MNTPNNKRKKESIRRIEQTFMTLVQTKEVIEISVTEICKKAKINRSTFYANYIDIFDLTKKVAEKLENEVFSLYEKEKSSRINSHNYLKLFKHIKDNQLFYKTYFKLNMDEYFIIKEYDTSLSKFFYDDKFVDYHIEFFMAGLNAIIKKWIFSGCKESPEEINQILESEYENKNFINFK